MLSVDQLKWDPVLAWLTIDAGSYLLVWFSENPSIAQNHATHSAMYHIDLGTG